MSESLTVGPLTVGRGERVRGWLPVAGTPIMLPLNVICGAQPGPTLLVTAGVHGGEYPGIESAIQLARTLDPSEMSGTVIVVPIVSPTAFQARLQYRVPEDGQNLNRQFPGKVAGTTSQRIAATVMAELAAHADAWVDLHGGDIHEELIPFTIYSAATAPEVRKRARQLAEAFGIRYLVESESVRGATYGAAAGVGIPAILTEAGDTGTLDPEMVAVNTGGLHNVLQTLAILPGTPQTFDETTTLHRFEVLTSAHVACWYPAVRAGDQLVQGQTLGELRNYFGELIEQITAPCDGVVLYRITSLAVDPGDPLVGIGA